ncbi:von Willebrand factor-like [Saccoglossus kowalevskii]|uniref:von Willebrand factor-like n=1 Tax=Saccoglossus kowalevskii TaxID=10224 RepID=A0ABM0M282_SACKO|nr:PREDICTED: von Willebrand factor-like [Saccoglossus kowalevskii]
MEGFSLKCVIVLAIFGLFLSDVRALKENKSRWNFPRTIPIDHSCNVAGSCTVEPSEGVFMEGFCAAMCPNTSREVYDYKKRQACGDDSCRCCIEEKEIVKRSPSLRCNLIDSKDCYQHGGYCQDWNEDGACEAGTRLSVHSTPLCLVRNCFCCKPQTKGQPLNQGYHTVVFLDPHFRTFDNRQYNYNGQGGCSYVLFQECVHNPSFFVVIHLDYKDKTEKTLVEDVTVHVDDMAVTLVYNNDIFLNGKLLTKPLPWKVGDFSVNRYSEHVKVTLDSKFSLLWNGKGRVAPTVNPSLYGKVCGLMGNADDNPDNDFQTQMPDGTLQPTNDTRAFGDSWLIPGSC